METLASFIMVLAANPYREEIDIEKLECVGHVRKRCGTRLRKIINENQGKKLDDGKGIGGAGKLTKKKIATLQNYFGFSVRQNSNNLERMRATLWQSYITWHQVMKIHSIIFALKFLVQI